MGGILKYFTCAYCLTIDQVSPFVEGLLHRHGNILTVCRQQQNLREARKYVREEKKRVSNRGELGPDRQSAGV